MDILSNHMQWCGDWQQQLFNWQQPIPRKIEPRFTAGIPPHMTQLENQNKHVKIQLGAIQRAKEIATQIRNFHGSGPSGGN